MSKNEREIIEIASAEAERLIGSGIGEPCAGPDTAYHMWYLINERTFAII